MKKAYFSKRIYKDRLSESVVSSIQHTLFVFNQAKHTAFQTQVKEKRSGESLRIESMHLMIKKKYGLNDYYTNSAVQESNALWSSQQELKKLYIENKEEQFKATKKKIKSTKQRLTDLQKIKQSFIKGKPTFNKTSPEQQRGRFFVVEYKKVTHLYEHAYAFEHTYLDPKIKELRSRLGNLEFRLDRHEKQLKSLKNKVKSVVFGTKKLMKAQYTLMKYEKDHARWKRDFDQARFFNMTISGRKDAGSGNFVFTYDLKSSNLHFMTIDGNPVSLSGVEFPYGQEFVNEAITQQHNTKVKKKYGQPIAWSIEDHGRYYIVKCLIDRPVNPQTNFSRATGVIGVDCNVDRLAFSNINEKGQNLKTGSIPFEIEGKTSGQVDKIIECAAIGIVQIAERANKPLVVEKLDTTKSKVGNPYGNQKSNRKMSLFAYRKLLTAIKNRADKQGVAVFEVNPAYTSQMGKLKYMKRFGTSIHECAAYVIARRAMGFKEKLPPVLDSLVPEKIQGLHHWVHWKHVSTLLSDIRKHAFYRIELFDVAKFCLTGELFPSGALTDLEKTCLVKLKSK